MRQMGVLRSVMSLLILASSILTVDAAYIVKGVTGNVKVISGGKSTELREGMKISPSDVIDIPEGGSLDVFNELDNKIYTSVKTGQLSVIRLMLDAQQKAADNRGNVHDQMSVGKGASNVGRVYMEKGMVKRSQASFGQDSENVDVDPKTLARYVASVVYSGDLNTRTMLPVNVEHYNKPESGVGFRLVNTADFPVYFNVLKISGVDAPVLEVSELGQPEGCYVVLPGQSLSREQFAASPADVRHVLIVSHCRYDIKEVVDIIGDLLSTEGVGTLPEEDAPVHMIQL